MSVEAAPVPSTIEESPKPGATASFNNEVVALLEEQTRLLRELVQTMSPSRATEDPDVAFAKSVAASIEPTDEVRYVSVDLVTRKHAVGRSASAATRSLNTDSPPERILAVPAGGQLHRLPNPRRAA